MKEADIQAQVLAIFDKMKLEDESVCDWFRMVFAPETRDAQADIRAQRAEPTRQTTLLPQQQQRLLNMRSADEINEDAFARKHTELRDRLALVKLQLDVLDRTHDEPAAWAAEVCELAQTLKEQWPTTNYATTRRLQEIVCLNGVFDNITRQLTRCRRRRMAISVPHFWFTDRIRFIRGTISGESRHGFPEAEQSPRKAKTSPPKTVVRASR